MIEGLRGDESIAELCRQEGIAQSMYYKSPEGDRRGRKNFWKLENNGWLATRSGKLRLLK